jgi:hypothetical protein
MTKRSKAQQRAGARRGGRARTLAKRRAARANGCLGGRPRKDVAAARARALAVFDRAVDAGDLDGFVARLESRSWHSLRRLAEAFAVRAAAMRSGTT